MRHCSLPASPESFLFPRLGPSRTLKPRGQSATFQWLHMQGGFWTPSWGVGAGQEGRQGGKSSAEEDSAYCAHMGQGPRSWGSEGNRGPKRSLQTRQAAGTQPPQVRHTRNYKKHKRTQQTSTGLSSSICKTRGLAQRGFSEDPSNSIIL